MIEITKIMHTTTYYATDCQVNLVSSHEYDVMSAVSMEYSGVLIKIYKYLLTQNYYQSHFNCFVLVIVYECILTICTFAHNHLHYPLPSDSIMELPCFIWRIEPVEWLCMNQWSDYVPWYQSDLYAVHQQICAYFIHREIPCRTMPSAVVTPKTRVSTGNGANRQHDPTDRQQ